MITINITNCGKKLPFNHTRLRKAIKKILQDAGVNKASISVALVDDATLAELHGRFLGDPSPSDVMSFPLERSPEFLEGEIVVSREAVAANAPHYGNSPEDELLLYVIHGMLHLLGYDDDSPRRRAIMRRQEQHYLALFHGP